MKLTTKESSHLVASDMRRPGPRKKTSGDAARADLSPHRTYAQVAATPSPPRERPALPQNMPSRGHPDRSPAASVMELSSSSDEVDPFIEKSSPRRVDRVPSSRVRGSMTTRASNGIVKKRVLEDAAVFSDQESIAAIPPSKKQKVIKPRGESNRVPASVKGYKLFDAYAETRTPAASLRSGKHGTQRTSALVSDFSSSDDTPAPSIETELQKQKLRKNVTDRSDFSASRGSLKGFPGDGWSFKPESVKVEYDDEAFARGLDLLPPVEIRSHSKIGAPSPSPAPEFREWQKREKMHYSEVGSGDAQRPRGRVLQQPKTPGKRPTERGASPLNWSASPPPPRTSRSKGKGRVADPTEEEPLPSPPLQRTSRSKGKGRAADPMEEEPLPIPRDAETISDEDEFRDLRRAVAASHKARVPSKKMPGSSSREAASADPSETASAPKINSFAAALAKKGIIVGGAPDKSRVSSPHKEQYFADLNGHHVASLPEKCEVNCINIHDVLLAEDYASLPNLMSWSSATGDGYVMFSGWATQLPGLDIDHALSAVRFAQNGRFVNLSRVSPLNLNSVFTAHDLSKSCLHADQRMAICLSPILVVESHLLVPSDRGLRNKFIKGTLHEQEMQHLVGATCMAFGHGTMLHAQIERDAMIFSTRGNWQPDVKPGTPSSSRYIRSTALMSKSPNKARPGTIKQILDVTDIVPIYDARNRTFDYAKDLDRIESVLPKLGSEIPSGSFAVVAYTMSTFNKMGSYHLNTNVQFVILVQDFEE